MNKFFYFFIIILLYLGCSCKNTSVTEKVGTSLSRNTENIHIDENYIKKINCSALDFLKLREEKLQLYFFNKLDSVRNLQYPDNNQEVEIMVDLSRNYLNQFLKDIDEDVLLKQSFFEKKYSFNIAPKGYSDSAVCVDKISIQFNSSTCNFKIKILNRFLADTDWCTESVVIYGFKIEKDKIVNFWRNEAG